MRDREQAGSGRYVNLSRVSPLVFSLLLVTVLGAGALLRFYRLDAQSFWNDEGNSARIAERSIDLIVEGAAGDIHPPGYYLLLHAWRSVFGQSEFALRSLSVVAGEALILLTCLVGCRLFGRPVGVLAAAVTALSPFAIYYSQEARMYALLGALSAGAMLAAFWTLDRVETAGQEGGERGPRVAGVLLMYALVNAAGLYTHYAFIFILAAHNALFAVRWLTGALRTGGGRRTLSLWADAQAMVALLYLPWLRPAFNAVGWSSAGGEYRLGRAVLDVVRVLTVGSTQPLGEAAGAMTVMIGLMLVGLLPRLPGTGASGANPQWTASAGLSAYLAVPLALFFGLDLYKPAWMKFLIVLLPSFYVLVARGVVTLSRVALWAFDFLKWRQRLARSITLGVSVAVFAALMYPSLHNLYFDSGYARDDYRQLAADLRQKRRPGDAIVLNAPNQWEVFTYYYPDEHVYPAPYRPAPRRASSFLSPLAKEYERLFVVYWGDTEADPQRQVETWLSTHAYKAGDRWYGDVRLAMYGLSHLPEKPWVVSEAVFGDRIALHGHTLVGESFAGGDVIPVTLFWESLVSIEEPYKVSVQLLDEEGRLVSQVDGVPRDGLAPTTLWQPGEILIDRYGVVVPGDVSAGRHSVNLVVYQGSSGRRLEVETGGETPGDTLVLEHVTVEPAG